MVAPANGLDPSSISFIVRDTVDLSTNALAGGPYQAVIVAITDIARHAHAYPATTSQLLRDAIAERHHLDANHVVPTPGSITALQRLIDHHCTTDDQVMFTWPNFAAFPDLAEAAGAQQQRIPPGPDGSVDLDALLAAICSRTRVIIVCNPHNPSGTLLGRAALRRFLEEVPDHILVILDEAYSEFADALDAGCGVALAQQRWAAGQHSVVVVRTLSKALGLGGLRIGYALAPPLLAAQLRARATRYEISSIAHDAALAALGAEDEVALRCRDIAAERRRVRNTLRDNGFTVSDSHGNFVWLPLGVHALGFAQHLLSYGIRVLPYAGDGVRITVGTPQENSRLLAAARAWPATTRPTAPPMHATGS